jgi:molybdopterin/thiamine biosynthesis adenylyltransferase
VSCLDSRAARLRLAARAWRAGSPFVDAAVGGGASLLARTTVYVPEEGAPCFECAFDETDYAALEQVEPCAGAAAVA